MLIARKSTSLVILITAATITTACVGAPSLAKPVPVEVWRGGDDGLTSRFADALEGAFRGSSAFVLSVGKKPGTLIITIPSNVGWKQIGSRTEVHYSVTFTGTSSQAFGASKGACWEDQLSKCAVHVLKDAEVVRAKMTRKSALLMKAR